MSSIEIRSVFSQKMVRKTSRVPYYSYGLFFFDKNLFVFDIVEMTITYAKILKLKFIWFDLKYILRINLTLLDLLECYLKNFRTQKYKYNLLSLFWTEIRKKNSFHFY